MPSNHLSLCHPLFLPHSIFSSIRVFSSKSVLCIRWPKDWSLGFSISPSNECLGLISFRIDRQDLLAVQGTFKSLLHCHSSALSFLYSPTLTSIHDTGKTIALIRQTFVGKVMSLFFNLLSRLIIAFLPRSKRLLNSWLQLPSVVIFGPRKIKSLTFQLFPHLCAMK